MLSRTWSQNIFNVAVHDENEYAQSVLAEIGTEIYFFSYGYPISQGGFIYKYNSSGQQQWRKIMPASNITHGIVSLDQQLVIAGTRMVCDVISNPVNFISKYDAAGNSVFTTTIVGAPGKYFTGLLQRSDSSYVAFTDSLMFEFDKYGNYVIDFSLPLRKISSAVLAANGNFVLSANQNGVSLRITLSPQGSVLSSQPLPVLMNKMILSGNERIVGLGKDGALYRMSAGGILSGQSNFSGNTVTDFMNAGDTLYALVRSAANIPGLLVCDSLFNQLSLSSTSTQSISQMAISRFGSKLAILSKSPSSSAAWNRQQNFVTLNVIDKSGSNNFSQDIQITAVKADSSRYEVYTVGNYKYGFYLKASVTVKNKGSRALTQFKLNCFQYAYPECGFKVYQEQFNIPPVAQGDSVTVTTGSFVHMPLMALPGSSTLVPATFCFYSTLPNGEADAVLADNELCHTVNFQITSAQDLKNVIPGLLIYPSPAETILYIKAGEVLKTIEVVNLTGQVMQRLEFNSSEVSIETDLWPPGIYFIRLNSAQGVATKKVIKN